MLLEISGEIAPERMKGTINLKMVKMVNFMFILPQEHWRKQKGEDFSIILP